MAAAKTDLTPTAGRTLLQRMRPAVTAAADLARARANLSSGVREPSLFPGRPALFVGCGAHACDVDMLKRLGISAVLNCAPSVCHDPTTKFKSEGIAYEQIDALDDREFPIIDRCLGTATAFIRAMHCQDRGVLVHCMAGVNRSATLAIAYLLLRDRLCLFDIFGECAAARPSILQNPSFQLQLCALASRNGLLYESGKGVLQPAPAGARSGPSVWTPASTPPPSAGGSSTSSRFSTSSVRSKAQIEAQRHAENAPRFGYSSREYSLHHRLRAGLARLLPTLQVPGWCG
jgi:hypothetical protein